MNLCVNCQHFIPAGFSELNKPLCGNSPIPPHVDPVTGKNVHGDYFPCSIERGCENVTACGKEGRFFKPKTEPKPLTESEAESVAENS